MTREEAERELCRLLEEAEADIQAGRTIPAEEVFAQLREKFAPRNIVYLTGDTHGRFERIVDFCSRREMDRENTFHKEPNGDLTLVHSECGIDNPSAFALPANK